MAPATASTSSPRVTGRVLPMNCAVKSSSPHFWPKPAVSPLASTVSAVMVPLSRVAVTVTSLAKPFMVAVASSPVASSAGASVASSVTSAAGAAARLFRASTTAVEVMVAPATASTSSPRVTGRVLPMNCAVKSSSPHFWPKPAVSPLASTVSAVMVPLSRVAVTVTSLAKPFMVAVASSPVAGVPASSAAPMVPVVILPSSAVRVTVVSPV